MFGILLIWRYQKSNNINHDKEYREEEIKTETKTNDSSDLDNLIFINENNLNLNTSSKQLSDCYLPIDADDTDTELITAIDETIGIFESSHSPNSSPILVLSESEEEC